MRSVFTFLGDPQGAVTIAIGLRAAAIFGFFFKPVPGQALVAGVTMSKEPLE